MALNATQAAMKGRIEADIAKLPDEAQAMLTAHLPWVQQHYLIAILAFGAVCFVIGWMV